MKSVMKYKLIIFDFDGTLADSFPWFVGVVNKVAVKYKFKEVAPDEIEALRSLSAMQLIRHLEIPLWKIPMIANYVRQQMARERDGITPFVGVDQLLAQLSQAGVILALVTSNSYENVRHVLGANNLALLSYLECDVPMLGKRARYRKILKKSGIAASAALSIGDEIRDIEASNQERIPFGAVAWGYTHVDALKAHAPAEVFTQIDDILKVLSSS
jgi:phosphoglycolate phosphatase